MFYSWYASDTQKPVSSSAYVLIPQKFGGGYIEEHNYKGDGIFGGQNIYELVADWNKDALSEKNDKIWLKPNEKSFAQTVEGKQAYSIACKVYRQKTRAWRSFKSQTVKQMKNLYGENYKANLGLDIACYDEQNEILPFPIKITEKPALYEAMNFSRFYIEEE